MRTNTLHKVDWDVLNDYIENNLIVANKHPEYDIWILNYSPKTQSKRVWDDYTLACCGLIIDADGNILARPFKKFFNVEEHDPKDIDLSKGYEIYEKMDGLLIILFYYKPRMTWIVASRGSFISEQSIEAKRMIDSKTYDYLDYHLTYLFEVIYPENRIVVNYGDMNELVLLGVVKTKTGDELSHDSMKYHYSRYFTIVKKYGISNVGNLMELKKLEEDNREGFVVKIGDDRFKVKFTEYVRLHGVLTNVSNIVIWEHLKNNYDFDALFDRVPDEFYEWLKKTIKMLQNNFNEIERLALKEFIRIYHINQIINRKEFAAEAVKTNYRSILFRLYDRRPYDEIIWKEVRPVFTKPFKDGYELPE